MPSDTEKPTKDVLGSRRYQDLTAYERGEALALADELMLRMVIPRRIVAALRQQYSISGGCAKRLLDQAGEAVDKVISTGLARRREQHIRAQCRLYERAWTDGKLSICLGVLRAIAEVEGFNRPIQIETTATGVGAGEVSAWERDAAGRPPGDIQHYLAHGCWPEESPNPPNGSGAPDATAARFVFPLTRH
jgi:hypothetical protein